MLKGQNAARYARSGKCCTQSGFKVGRIGKPDHLGLLLSLIADGRASRDERTK